METRSKQVNIRLTPTQLTQLKELAAERECTITDLLLDTLLPTYEDAVAEQRLRMFR